MPNYRKEGDPLLSGLTLHQIIPILIMLCAVVIAGALIYFNERPQ